MTIPNFVYDNTALYDDKADPPGRERGTVTQQWDATDAQLVKNALLDIRTVLRRSVDVRQFGAVGDGVTNDTAAIQAALDYGASLGGGFAAGARGFVVHIPASPTPYMFSNLVIPGYARLVGDSMAGGSTLKRIVGSTGAAIRERNHAEDPSDVGASGVWIQYIKIDGNGTAGDGISLGQVGGPTPTLNFLASLDNVSVFGFPSGSGFKLSANAVSCKYLWSNVNQIGINITNGGGNVWHSLWAEGNTNNDIIVSSGGDSFHGIQTEPVAGTNPSILVNGSQNVFFGIFVGMSAGNKNELIKNAAGANRNSYYGVHIDAGAHTFTHAIRNEIWSGASTGSSNFRIQEYIVGENSGVARWYVNQSTGASITTIADLLTMASSITLKGAGARASAPNFGTHVQGEIFFNADPIAGGKIGWVCVTGGSPGTWKAFGAIDP